MRRMAWLLVALLSVSGMTLWAQNERGNGRAEGTSSAPAAHPATRPAARPAAQARPAPVSSQAPVVINMNRGTSGGHNRNFPSQQPVQRPAQQPSQGAAPAQRPQQQPSYGQLHWNAPAAQQPQRRQAPSYQQVQPWAPSNQGRVNSRPNPQPYRAPGVNAAVAVHHHPYTQGYVRKKLQKLGVTAEPNLITDRAEIIHTDRAHSIIRYPQRGLGSHGRSTVGGCLPGISTTPLSGTGCGCWMGPIGGDRINGLYVTKTGGPLLLAPGQRR